MLLCFCCLSQSEGPSPLPSSCLLLLTNNGGDSEGRRKREMRGSLSHDKYLKVEEKGGGFGPSKWVARGRGKGRLSFAVLNLKFMLSGASSCLAPRNVSRGGCLPPPLWPPRRPASGGKPAGGFLPRIQQFLPKNPNLSVNCYFKGRTLEICLGGGGRFEC